MKSKRNSASKKKKQAAPAKGRARGHKPQAEIHWSIEVDLQRCSLCEACARRCPEGALVVRRNEGAQELVFTPPLCNACQGKVLCRQTCPEEAIRISETASILDQAVLVRSRMLHCRRCRIPFVSERTIEGLKRRSPGRKPEIRLLCPQCRREELLTQPVARRARGN